MGEQAGYGIVMKETLYCKGLSIEAKAIYAFLAVHADKDGYSFPEVSTICDFLEIGEQRFYKHMARLKAAGVVEVTRKRDGTKFSHNVYRLTDRNPNPTIPSTENQYPENPGTELHQSHTRVLPPTEIQYPSGEGTNNTTLNKTKRFNNPNDDIYKHICALLNQAKAKAHSKGRLKPDTYIINQLREMGMVDDAIILAAKDLADRGQDVTWFSLRDYCEVKGYIPRIERRNRR